MSGTLPNPTPRPPGELEALKRAWRPPPAWRFFTDVNNTVVGLLYVGTALVFFVLAGILALIMRTQLAVPGNDLVSQPLYNQLFTMHGTVMMFLFAVPAVEAMAVYLLPNMLGARDLPFPRLGMYAYWAYAVGGLVFFTSIFWDLAPDGGWFMYPPLTSYRYSPGDNADFWLLGIGFIEISAIAGAIEIVVGVMRTRAPGMTLDKLPVYAWAMLVFAGMIVFGFPAVILCTMLLELERAFQWPFFVAELGGDPVLWQHLFWFFGHPEVYIIFLPAAGMVSMIVPTMARTPLVGYRLSVLSLIAVGFLSFFLWVHHMFAVGMPELSLAFFSAASMAVAIPTGIQIFAWIATIAKGRLSLKTPSLFILGFLFIFTLGGLTGVMVAMVPFDWQAHDSYFVVAHLHYVLIGGMVFPLFGAFYYWVPLASKRAMSERLGRWVFGLMFVGVNVTFLPMHLTGLLGMPRRVHSYPEGLGWDGLNLLSTAGSYLIGLGVLVFLVDLARNFRPTSADTAGDVWQAGTLEWLPNDTYATRSIPIVASREPLWDQPGLAAEVEAGAHYLPGTATGRRETIVTSPIDAKPQYLLLMPGPSWPAFVAAVATAAAFLLLTVKLVVPAAVCGVGAVAAVLWWMWDTDPGPVVPDADIGGGIRLPVTASGPSSHSWWATATLVAVSGALYASMVFAYLFLWTVSPEVWPDASGQPVPGWMWPAAGGLLLAASGLAMAAAGRALGRCGAGQRAGQGAGQGQGVVRIGLVAAVLLLSASLGVEVWGQWQSGLRPTASAYGAAVYMMAVLQGQLVVTLAIMGLYTVARSLCGRLHAGRRATFDNTALLWRYTVGQGLTGLLVVHGLPLALAA